MATAPKTKKSVAKPKASATAAAKASATRSKTAVKKPTAASRPRSAANSPGSISTLEQRAILLVTLFVALCILFVQVYIRNR